MTKTNRLTGALAITALGSLALLTTSAAAWDELPCGDTEATAHFCAPGEVARDGTIPVPAPLPVLPPPVVLAPLVTTPGTPDVLQPQIEPGVVIVPAKPAARSRRVKPSPITCKTRWKAKPKLTVRYTLRHADGWFYPIAARGRLCGVEGGVAG